MLLNRLWSGRFSTPPHPCRTETNWSDHSRWIREECPGPASSPRRPAQVDGAGGRGVGIDPMRHYPVEREDGCRPVLPDQQLPAELPPAASRVVRQKRRLADQQGELD